MKVTDNNAGATTQGINIGTTSTATLLVDDGTVISGGTLTVGADGTLDVEKGTSGPGATLDGVAVTSGGIIDVGAASTATLTLTATTINGDTLVDNGTVVANGSVNVGSAVTTISTGAFTIDNGATLEFSSSVAAGITVSFAGATGTLQFDDPTGFAGTVSNFGGSNVIDLTDIAYSSSEHTVWTQSTGTLAIYLGATLEDTIKLSGTYNQDNFSLAPDFIPGTPGTDVVWVAGSGDAYVWASVAGSWDAAGNWDDVTAGQSPASVAPGSNDSVTFDAVGGGGFNVVTGVGDWRR